MGKKDIGTVLVNKQTGKTGTVKAIDKNSGKICVEYLDGETAYYSASTIKSKFSILTKADDDNDLEALTRRQLINYIQDLQHRLKFWQDMNKLDELDSRNKNKKRINKDKESEEVKNFIKDRLNGESYRQIANKYNRSQSYVFYKIKAYQEKNKPEEEDTLF